MIRVSHLTRRFAGVTAVDDLDFEVAPGEIVGFLGPNGAGKTTTLRVLAGFLPPTSGEVVVAGCAVDDDPLEARRNLGYLPENCPLYPEMRVHEYLRFRAALKGVPVRKVRRRVNEVLEVCGLVEVRRRIVGQLSKGYRQRVGLADTLVHEPRVLLLDEPTIGLDPNQLRQVRDLIRSFAGRHTVLLSTHLLPEVEMTCARVLILHRGRLLASDSTENLRRLLRRRGRITAELRGPADEVRETLAALAGAAEVRPREDGWVEAAMDWSGEEDLRPKVFDAAVRRGWALRELSREPQSLEDIFVALTNGGGLPPGGPA